MDNTMQPQLHSNLFESPTITTPDMQSRADAVLASITKTSQSNYNDDVPSAGSNKRNSFRILRLVTVYAMLFTTPIAAAYGINIATAAPSMDTLATVPAESTMQSPDYQTAVPASVTGATSNDFEYELSLANGFLQKAVKTSNASESQTVEEKNMIIQLLTQALEAANRAISISPTDARGYSSRGRVYQATSVIKPEMKALADADFAKAQELGAINPSEAPATQDPMQLLPTEQAATGQQAVIASPEENVNSTISGSEGANANRGSVSLQPGQQEIFVPYTGVQADTQLYVNADINPENVTFYVKNKEEGVGFTIASTAAPSSPVEISWWEIE